MPCLPDSIDVCLAVWEQFWCDRAGLVCGSWAFQRVRRRCIPARAKCREDVFVSGGMSPMVTASKRVNPFGSVLRRRRCFGLSSSCESRPLVPFRLVKSGRDHKWDAGPRVGVVSSRFSPELADTQPHSGSPWLRSCVPGARALVETWLILPVVICLSQRLSHACLSISFYMAKLRMAH